MVHFHSTADNESIVISGETSSAQPTGSKPNMPGILEQSLHGSQIIDSTQAATVAPITVKILETKEWFQFEVVLT